MKKNEKKQAEEQKTLGRPKLPEGSARTKRLDDVRFSAEELASLKGRAAKAGESWSTWVRARLGL